MEHESKSAVREFSKEHGSEARKGVAENISQKRREHFDKKESLEREILELTETIKKHETAIGVVIEEIKILEAELLARKTSTISEILNIFKIREIRAKLGLSSLKKEDLEREVSSLRSNMEKVREQSQDRHELDNAQEMMKTFYVDQKSVMEAYETEREIKDVGHIAEKYDAIFVHAIHPNFTPGENSLIKEGTPWATKLKILLAFEPTISTSTVQAGDNATNIWARVGVVLGGGEVQSAHEGDAGTRAEGLTKRENMYQKQASEQAIEDAVTRSTSRTGYNELVVANPSIAGLFICVDNPKDTLHKQDSLPLEEMQKAAMGVGLPLYAMHKGEIFEIDDTASSADGMSQRETVSFGSDTISLGRKIKPQELGQHNQVLDNFRREQLQHEILAESPFEIKKPEKNYIESKNNGAEAYLQLHAGEKNSWMQGIEEYQQIPPRKYYDDRWDREGIDAWDYIPNGEPIKKIAQWTDVRGDAISYFLVGPVLHKKTLTKRVNKFNPLITQSKVEDIGLASSLSVSSDLKHGYITHGNTATAIGRKLEGNERSMEAIKNDKDYLDGMKNALAALPASYEKTYKNDPIGRTYLREQQALLAFHLRGFAEQAQSNNDSQIAAAALELAASAIPRETMDEILSRRVGTNGEFLVTKEDLE